MIGREKELGHQIQQILDGAILALASLLIRERITASRLRRTAPALRD